LKTVFVIGAGASKEANLPVGDELKDHIAHALNFPKKGDELIAQAFQYLKSPYCGHYQAFSSDELYRASRRIHEGLPLVNSIDNFLHSHNVDKAIEVCGKLAIARTILRAEQASTLFISATRSNNSMVSGLKDKWFNFFFSCLNEGCSIQTLEERLSSTALVIFNYDRCVEHYIFHSLQIFYGISRDRAAELLKLIEIYHPYGTVGSLPYIRGEGASEFGDVPHPTKLIDVAAQIKTFTEGTDEGSSAVCAIRDRIKQAKRLVFVGFAFHPMNIELLLPRTTAREHLHNKVYATAYRLSSNDEEIILKDLVVRGMLEDNIEFVPYTCADFFRSYRRALSFA
jgi:hypothetical protein